MSATTPNQETEMSTIRQFLAIPPWALPSAEYAAEPGLLHPWSALRCAVSRDSERREMADGCGPIRLVADLDGWRDGVVVTL